MALTDDAHVEELVRCLGLRSLSQSASIPSIHEIIDAAALLDIVLYVNTYETVLFWSLRSLVRAANRCASTAASSPCPTALSESQQARHAELLQACDAVQAAQDALHSVLVPRLVKPSLVRLLTLYVDDTVFDDSTLARDVEALFCANAYCVDATGAADEEEEDTDDDGMDEESSFVIDEEEEEEDTHSTAATSVTQTSRSPSSPLTDVEAPRPEGHEDHQPPPHCPDDGAQQRLAERRRQRRWQRARDCVLHTPPPLSSAATLMLSLVKALLQVYRHAQHAHHPSTMVALAAQTRDDEHDGTVSEASITRAITTTTTTTTTTTVAAVASPRALSHRPRFSHCGVPPPLLRPLPGLFAPVDPLSRYQAVAQHPYTIASLFPMATYAKPPHAAPSSFGHGASTPQLRGRRQGHRREGGEEDGLVLIFRRMPAAALEDESGRGAITSAPNTVLRRHRRWQSSHVRDPFARATAERRPYSDTRVPSAAPTPSAPLKRPREATQTAPSAVEAVVASAPASPSPSSSPTPSSPLPAVVRRACAAGIPGVAAELQHVILTFLAPRSVRTAARVCRLWRRWVVDPSSPFISPLPYYAAASQAVTRSYLRFFREDWGERCLQLPTSTCIQRLHAVRLGKAAALVQSAWDAIEAEAVGRQWVWTRARALRDAHVAGRHESVLRGFVESRDGPVGAEDATAEVHHARPMWGCAPAPPTRAASPFRELPIDYLLLHLWHDYPEHAPARQALVFLLEALRQELLFALLLPAQTSASCPASPAHALAVEELLRQQYLLWGLLQDEPSTGATGPRPVRVLYALWRHWPRVGALWAEMTQPADQID